MNGFNWKKGFGWGAVIWLVMFGLVSALIGFSYYGAVWVSVIVALIGGVLSFSLAKNSKTKSNAEALGYGALWTAIAIVLDYIVTMRFDSTIFTSWTYWFSMALILFAPWVEYQTREVSELTIEPR